MNSIYKMILGQNYEFDKGHSQWEVTLRMIPEKMNSTILYKLSFSYVEYTPTDDENDLIYNENKVIEDTNLMRMIPITVEEKEYADITKKIFLDLFEKEFGPIKGKIYSLEPSIYFDKNYLPPREVITDLCKSKAIKNNSERYVDTNIEYFWNLADERASFEYSRNNILSKHLEEVSHLLLHKSKMIKHELSGNDLHYFKDKAFKFIKDYREELIKKER